MKSTILKIILSLYLVGCFVPTLIAQNPKATTRGGNSPLHKGQLENGLTYYIYNDSTLKGEKIRMGFMVKAGSDKETASEQEFAHMIEHIPFVRDSVYPNGINRFLKFDMVPFADVTARTTYPYIKYWFHFPKSYPKAFKAGLFWFREIATELRFNEKMMDRVRSQVQGEMISRMSTLWHCAADKPYIDYRLYGMGERDFCNIVNDMEEYQADDLQAFYRRWYIPENMGIFVVGSTAMSTVQIIKEIKTRFADLKQPVKKPKAIEYDKFYLSQENQFINIDARSLIEIPEIQLYFRKTPNNGVCTKAALQLSLLDEMVGNLVASRFRKRSKSLDNQDIESILFYAQDYPPSFMVTPKLKSTTSIKKGIQLPIIEYRKIIGNGFTEAEFSSGIKQMKDKYVYRRGRNAKLIMDELYENFYRGNCYLPDEKAQHTKTILSELTKQDLNKRMHKLFNPKNKVDIVIKASDSSSYNLSKKQVYGWLDEAWKVSIEDWEAFLRGSKQIKVEPPKELLSQLEISRISHTTNYKINKIPEYGITEIEFSNGMKVVLKPFKPKLGFKDRLHLQVIKPGGASQFNVEDYAAALFSSEIVAASGLGSYSKLELEAYFQQPRKDGLQLSPYVNHTEIGFRGWCLPGRQEELLKYLYLYMNKPKVDSISLTNWKEQQKIKLLMDERNNDFILRDFLRNFFKGQPFISEESIDVITEKKIIDSYKSLFSDPKGYVLVISGDFDLVTTMKLCNKYLGSIPKSLSKRKLIIEEKKTPNNHTIPKGPLSFNLESNDPRKSDVRVIYSGGLNYNPKEDAGLFVLNKIFNDRLHNRLRNEEESSTVFKVFSMYDLFDNNNKYKFSISFSCVNSKTERMVHAVKDEIDKLKKHGPDSEVLQNVLDNIALYYMPAYEENAEHITMQYIDRYKHNKERVPIYKLKNYIQNITVADIKQLAQKYLKEENYYQFVASKKSSKVENRVCKLGSIGSIP